MATTESGADAQPSPAEGGAAREAGAVNEGGDATAAAEGDAGDAGAPADVVACAVDASGLPGVPVSGTISGADVLGTFCRGSASAYLENPPYSTSPFVLILTSSLPASVDLQIPTDATGTLLHVMTGVSAAAPGRYSSDGGACGGGAFSVYLPVPAGIDCGDAAPSCPSGCTLWGPVGAESCVPAAPERHYEIDGLGNCVDDAQAPSTLGSWTLDLTSVGPSLSGDGGWNSHYEVHGTFTASMIEADAGGATATLSLTF